MEGHISIIQRSMPGESASWRLNQAANGAGEARSAGSNQTGTSNPFADKQAEGTEKSVTFDDLKAAVAEIEDELDFMHTRICFQVDSDAGETVMRVVDRQTGEVVRQFPPEEFLKIRTAFKDFIRGIFFDKVA